MLDIIVDDILEDISKDLDIPKRKTLGRDRKKNYHKITISVDAETKAKVSKYAEDNGISVSKLIKDLLEEKGVI
ncbi:ribbon-helix-helix protein, CopG family [bacterium]|nr:ribbon-helix-helix protein, CopG family [bacterium]